jgi:2-polyprenyl-6-methoxyphenol hydroxylase-like FAD-dependent oxidoreductase
MTSQSIGRQAVVIGAGMGGLPAARVLADYFEHVVVLERDTLPCDPSHRAGTPQARHTHALLTGGQRALGELFQGFERDLAAAGAVEVSSGLDVRQERPGYDPFPMRDLGLAVYAMSRPLIEAAVRHRVNQKSNITIRQGCRAEEIVVSRDGSAVSAIRFKNNHARSETMATDLVVEASGRGNLTLDLLDRAGRARPEESVVGVDLSYATAVFTIPEDAPEWKGVMTLNSPAEGGLAGILLPLEGNRWIVTLVAHHGGRPPADHDGFLAHARQLRTTTIHEAISQGEQIGEVARFGFPASIRRHFDRLEQFPRGLLPFGDAICRFNPVYGQGMSVAACEARLLGELLAHCAAEPDPLAELASVFFAKSARLIDTPWALAATPDLADPRTQGPRPEDLRQRLEFGEALNHLAAQDGAVHKLLYEVLHLLKPQSVLRDPEIVERVKALAAPHGL